MVLSAGMHGFSPFMYPFFPGAFVAFLPLIFAAIAWTLVLKGFSLWFSARNEQKWWFIVLLVVNSLGILELIYLIWFRSSSKNVHSPESKAPGTPADN